MPVPSIVVLAVDGLRASALGAYGNTWFNTPNLDRLASEAFVFDQALAATASLPKTYESIWSGHPALAELTANRFGLLVADDPAVTGLSAAADYFQLVALAPEASPAGLAKSATETTTAATLALLLDELEQVASDKPVLAWAHLRFTGGPWDAPLDLAKVLIDEDDPHPTADLTPPRAESIDDDDAAFAATVRYAAQVMALDHCLGVLPAALDQTLGQGSYQLVVMGLRGFALGEHGRIGLDDQQPYNEMRHVPLMLRLPQSPQHRRSDRLLTLDALPNLLARTPEDLAAAGVDEVRLHSTDGIAYQDTHWKLYQPTAGEAELYSKPDDRWEMNDVAARHHHEVEELAARLVS